MDERCKYVVGDGGCDRGKKSPHRKSPPISLSHGWHGQRRNDVCDSRHCAIKQKRPPRDSAAGYPAVKNCQPADETYASAREGQTSGNQQGVDYGLMTSAPPWNGSQRRDLRANSQVEKSPKCVRGQRHGTQEPPE